MKGFGIALVVIGILGVGAGAGLAVIPPGLVVADAPGSCEPFAMALIGGDLMASSCLPTMFGFAWMVPSAILGSLVLVMLGALLVSSSRARELRSALAYTRSSKGLPSSGGSSLSGSGVPVSVAAGITSTEQSSYAVRAGYARGGAAPAPAAAAPAFTAPQQPAAAAFVAPQAAAVPQFTVPQDAAPAPQFVTPQPQYVQPEPQYAQPQYTEPQYAPAQQAEPQYAAHPAQPAPAAAPGGFIQPGTGYLPQ